jgi:hypothetical protein
MQCSWDGFLIARRCGFGVTIGSDDVLEEAVPELMAWWSRGFLPAVAPVIAALLVRADDGSMMVARGGKTTRFRVESIAAREGAGKG